MARKAVLMALIAGISAFTMAEQLTLEDGRKIELNPNGSWTYVSRDLILTTSDGRQVRVKEDGSWEYTGEVAPPPATGSAEITATSAGNLLLTLEELAIETARSSTHKNSIKKTNTVFTIAILNNAGDAAELNVDSSAVMVKDSGGRKYQLLDITPGAFTLDPGERVEVEFRADGSPHWFTTKAMELHLEDGAIPASRPLVLKGLMSTAKKREVSKL